MIQQLYSVSHRESLDLNGTFVQTSPSHSFLLKLRRNHWEMVNYAVRLLAWCWRRLLQGRLARSEWRQGKPRGKAGEVAAAAAGCCSIPPSDCCPGPYPLPPLPHYTPSSSLAPEYNWPSIQHPSSPPQQHGHNIINTAIQAIYVLAICKVPSTVCGKE